MKAYLLVNTPSATLIYHTRKINDDLGIYWIIILSHIKTLNFGTILFRYETYSSMSITRKGRGVHATVNRNKGYQNNEFSFHA